MLENILTHQKKFYGYVFKSCSYVTDAAWEILNDMSLLVSFFSENSRSVLRGWFLKDPDFHSKLV